ncbi:MAG: TIR domain-containing protein [Leptolyngbya sp. SIO4C5]|nr:TIR domain-containing protein [Leptolyngbya sp. SIO4C5]
MNSLQDAFISYGRADSRDFAKYLNDRLVEAGYAIWYDFEDIPFGVDYQKQIDDGIEKADNFLYIISPHSVNSPYCGLEVELALTSNKRIIPLLHVEQISRKTWQQRNSNGTDEQWADYQATGKHSSFPNMHPEIGKINWVYFREGLDDFETSFAGLLELLERHKAYVHQHTVLLDRALTWERNQKQTRYLLIGSDREQAQVWLATRFTESQPPCLPTDLQCEFITESIKNANNLMTQVFLCHAEEDRESAEQIRRSLLRQGVTVWNYRTDIQISQDYHSAIAQGIEAADNVLLMLSPHSAQSTYCQRELEQALAFNKRIIPILAAPIDPEQIPDNLRSLQQIDLTDNAVASDYLADESQLLKILNTDAAYYTEHKTWLTQALKWQRQQQNPTMLLRGYNLRRAENWLKVARTHRHLPTELHETFIAESLKQPPDPSLDVFISYSRVDSDFSRRLNETLQIHGKRTWFDQESIASGTDFQQEIYRGIESSDVFLFVLSPQSISSPYCADEVEYAYGLNKRIVTVLHRPIDTVDLHPVLAKLQWIDFRDHDGDFQVNFQNLLRTLDTNREHLETHTRLLLRAGEWDRRGRDESLLLRGQDLEVAENWLETYAEIDPRPTGLQQEYIRAGRARQTAQEAAEKKLRRGAFIGAVAAAAGVLVAVGSGWFAWTQQQQARASIQDADERIAEADTRVNEANIRVDEAKEQAKAANQQTEQANQQTQQAKQAQQAAVDSAKQAAQAQTQAETRAQEADGKAQSAAAAQRQAEAKAQAADEKAQDAEGRARTADVRALEADAKTAAAEVAQRLAQTGTRLEQAGTAVLRRLEFDHTGALLRAIKAGRELKASVAEADIPIEIISQYPAVSPILALQQLRSDLTYTLLAHTDTVNSASFNAASDRVVTASDDGTARVWNLKSGQFIPLEGHTNTVNSASFNAASDRVVTASDDGTAWVWNLKNGQSIPLEGHTDTVNSASFNAAGDQVVTTSSDGTARVWDLKNGQSIPLEGHRAAVHSASFNAAGDQVVTTSWDGTARVWDLKSGQFIPLEGHTLPVTSASFNTAGNQVVTTSDDGTARVWDLKNGSSIPLEGHTDMVTSASFNAAGDQVVTTSGDGTARVWDLKSGQFTSLEGHRAAVNSASFNAAGDQVVTTSGDGTARVWDLKSGQFTSLEGHRAAINSLTFNAAGDQVVTASDGTARVWDLKNGGSIPLEGHTDRVTSASFNAASEQVVTTSWDGTARLWNLKSGQFTSLEGHTAGVSSASFNAAGDQVVTTSWDGTARIWDLNSDRSILLEGHTAGVSSASFNAAGDQVVTASEDGTARVWDLKNGSSIPLEGHTDMVTSASFNAAGEQVVTTSGDGTARVWDLKSDQSIVLEGHTDRVTSASFNAASEQVVTTSWDGTARLWNLKSGQFIPLEGHTNAVNSASFDAAGNQVVTTSYDGTVRVWDLQGRQLAIYEGEAGALSPNGQQVVTVVDGSVQVHDIETLSELIDWGCKWLHNYLEYGQATDSDRALCNLPPRNSDVASSTLSESSLLSRALNQVRKVWRYFG